MIVDVFIIYKIVGGQVGSGGGERVDFVNYGGYLNGY